MSALARLQGRLALITGAGSGLGRAMAWRFAAEGARVTVNDLRPEAAEATLAGLRERGGEGVALVAAVADRAAAARLVQDAATALGRLDILVNNAGIAQRGHVWDISDADWQRMRAVHLDGAFACTRAALPLFYARGWGRIINITSLAGITGHPASAHYSAAKGGLIGLTRALAREAAGRGVTVNALAPGFADTPIVEELRAKGLLDRIAAQNPVPRLLTPAEVAAAAAYLASDEAAYIVGQVLCLGGGAVI